MKRLTLAIVIAMIFISLSIGGETYLSKLCSQFAEALEQSAQEIKAGDYEDARESLLRLSENWKNKRVAFRIFLMGGEPLTQGRDFYAVIRNMTDGNYSNALILIRECQSSLQSIIENLNVDFYYIL